MKRANMQKTGVRILSNKKEDDAQKPKTETRNTGADAQPKVEDKQTQATGKPGPETKKDDAAGNFSLRHDLELCGPCATPTVCKLCLSRGVKAQDATFSDKLHFLDHLAEFHNRCACCGEQLTEPVGA